MGFYKNKGGFLKGVVRGRAAVESFHVSFGELYKLYFSFSCECFSNNVEEYNYGYEGD